MENKEIKNIVKAMKAKRRDDEINLFGHTIHTQTMTKNKKKYNRNSKHKKTIMIQVMVFLFCYFLIQTDSFIFCNILLNCSLISSFSSTTLTPVNFNTLSIKVLISNVSFKTPSVFGPLK